MDTDTTLEQWEGASNHHPVGLDYTPLANFDATNGEFWVNAFREGYFSHNGASSKWYEAYLSAPRARQNGLVRNAGMWTSCVLERVPSWRLSIGTEIEPDYWLTGIELSHVYGGSSTTDDFAVVEILAMAFFIDVLRPDGEVVRLWLSRAGRNFTAEDALGRVGKTEQLGPTTFKYASDDAGILAAKPKAL